MISRRAFVGGLCVTAGRPVQAERIGGQNVRIVTPAPPGGSPDVAARLLAAKLKEAWGMPIWVDSRPGGEGLIALRALVDASDPVLLLAPSGVLTTTLLLRNAPFKLEDDFQPIASLAVDFLCVVASHQSKLRALDGLAETIKGRHVPINWFASAGAPLLAFRSFFRKRGLDTNYVPYRGGPDALRDLIEGVLTLR